MCNRDPSQHRDVSLEENGFLDVIALPWPFILFIRSGVERRRIALPEFAAETQLWVPPSKQELNTREALASRIKQGSRPPSLPRYCILRTAPVSCLEFFGNGPNQAGKRRVHVGYFPDLIVLNPLTPRSQKATVYRCCQDVIGHCKGIV